MGFRVAWIARQGNSTNELLQLSSRSISGERHESPDVGWYLLELPTADSRWVVLIADGGNNYLELTPAHARSASQDGNTILFFWCSDTVMCTELLCFKDGVEHWSIEYDCGDEKKRPAMSGEMPSVAHQILRDLQTQQRADDQADYIYELTAELGLALIGFRHDQDLKLEDPQPFQVLGKPKKSRGWFFWK